MPLPADPPPKLPAFSCTPVDDPSRAPIPPVDWRVHPLHLPPSLCVCVCVSNHRIVITRPLKNASVICCRHHQPQRFSCTPAADRFRRRISSVLLASTSTVAANPAALHHHQQLQCFLINWTPQHSHIAHTHACRQPWSTHTTTTATQPVPFIRALDDKHKTAHHSHSHTKRHNNATITADGR